MAERRPSHLTGTDAVEPDERMLGHLSVRVLPLACAARLRSRVCLALRPRANKFRIGEGKGLGKVRRGHGASDRATLGSALRATQLMPVPIAGAEWAVAATKGRNIRRYSLGIRPVRLRNMRRKKAGLS
jgi:hypothetical protein